MANRFNVMANFLNANAKETLDSSATAFTLLADVPLSKISRYYSPAGGLDIGNPNFRKEVTAILKDRGMKPNAIDEFFRSCETNKKDVDDALEKTFFYASALEGNDVLRDRASILLAKAKSEGGLTALLKKNPIIEFQGQKIQAQDLYRLLVQQGMTIANEKPKRTLLEFIQNSVMTNGRNPNIPREGLAGKNPSVPQEGNHGVNPNIPGSANTGTNPDVPPSVNVGKNPGVPKKGSSAVQENVNIQENKKGVDPNIPQAQ